MFVETSSFLQAAEPEALKKVRQNSWDRFLELGVPSGRDESFEYLQLKSLLATRLQKAAKHEISKEKILESVFPGCEKSFLVFINGWFCADLSDCTLPKGALLMSLSQAMKMFGSLLSTSFSNVIKEEKDRFALLNAACHQDGAFLYLPPKTVLSNPIQILSIIDESHSWIMPRLHLFAGAFSEAKIVQRTVCHQGQGYLYNSVVDVLLEDGAKVQYSLDDMGLPSSESWIFDSFRIALKPHASFKGFQITNSEKSRRDWKIALAGQEAEVELNGVWILDENKEAHTNVLIDHQKPYCRSMQLFKGVLNDESISSFQGKILVQQEATKTESYQSNRNLMLSDKAKANSKPNLEIHSSDVKASHGATTGQLDEDQLFYLKTRGVSHIQARNCMINGFCQDVAKQLFLPAQYENFCNHLSKYAKV